MIVKAIVDCFAFLTPSELKSSLKVLTKHDVYSDDNELGVQLGELICTLPSEAKTDLINDIR